MPVMDRRRPGAATAPLKLTPKLFLSLLAAFVLAVLSFSQTAASTGIRIDGFRPLGGSFFAWRSGQNMLAVELLDKGKRLDADRLVASGRGGLSYAPLSSRSLWMVGRGYEAQKNLRAARRVMARAAQVTRRDAAVQLWLAEDSFRRSQIAQGLGHYDLIIRSEPAAGAEILPRLAAVMVAPDGRRYLQRYVGQANPWYPDLLRTAVDTLPKAEPIGRLLIENGAKAPSTAELEPIYAKLVSRLVDEGAQDVAMRLYPLLPHGKTAALGNVSGVIDGKLDTGYPPFIWSFANDAFGASLVNLGNSGNALEFYGGSGTVGMAASKLISPKSGSHLRWRIHDRSANLQSAATWVATCVAGKAKGVQVTSINLLNASVPLNRTLSMPLPASCDVVRLDMRIAGGIGTAPASLIVGHLALSDAASAK